MASEDPTDEVLMAHADGELSADEAEAVEAAAARDPGVAGRLEAFHRSARLVKAAMPLEPVPGALASAVAAAVAAAGTGAGQTTPARNVVSLDARRPATRPSWVAMPVAAAILAVATGLGGYLIGRDAATPAGVAPIAALNGLEPAIVAALDRLPSGRTAEVTRGEIRLLQSFRTGAGTLCREFADADNAHTIACRRDGGWRAELVIAGKERDPADGYAPAAGDDEVTSAWLAAAAAGPALDSVAEAGALAER